jgi:hypothetical protein
VGPAFDLLVEAFEMLGDEILKIMDRMSASYCQRLGAKPEAIAKAHRAFVDNLFKDGP